MASTTAPPRAYRVAELAAEVGVRPDTIRYYERAGLLPPPPRTSAGYAARRTRVETVAGAVVSGRAMC